MAQKLRRHHPVAVCVALAVSGDGPPAGRELRRPARRTAQSSLSCLGVVLLIGIGLLLPARLLAWGWRILRSWR